jgi:hypothetical protein
MDALRGCLATTPTWLPGTAPSSLEHASATVEAYSPVDEQVPSLPTIQSISELETSPKPGSPSSPLRRQKSASRTEFPTSRGLSEPPPSRRESTASLKNIFGPVTDPDAVTVTRASPQARSVVDALLEDVFSVACHSARSYAEAHSETLFHVSPTFGAAAKSRLTKRESVHVRRRRSYVEITQAVKATRKVQQSKVPPTLALDCITTVEQVGVVPSPDCLFDSPTVASQCSSATGSRDASNAASPLADTLELPSSVADPSLSSGSDNKSAATKPEDLLAAREVPPKRSRSLVENFRGFILPHTTPPVRTLSVSRLSVFPTPPPSPSTPPSPSQRRILWRESIRRRSRSSPFVTADVAEPPTAAAHTRHRAESAGATPSSQRHQWNAEELAVEPSTPSPRSATSTPRRSLFGGSAPRASPTMSRSMLRSILASFSRSPSSASVAQGS